jgi:peptidoglycan hydrolase-like protein with peptidoglycan-binding domain
MGGRRSTRRWIGVAVALLVLAFAAVAGGFALREASREVVARGSDDRAEALQRLQADRAARDRRARAAARQRARATARQRARAEGKRHAGAGAKSGSAPRTAALRRGSGYSSPRGSRRVRRLQRALRRLDLVPREVLSRRGEPVRLIGTGQFGPATERGVRRFQRRAGLPVTGIADARTLQRIYAAARAQGRERKPVPSASSSDRERKPVPTQRFLLRP